MTASEPSRPRFAATMRRWGPLALLSVIAIVVWTQWGDLLTFSTIGQQREYLSQQVSENFALALAAYAICYVVVVAVSLPGGAFQTLVGGFLFGWLVGGLVTVFAATAGATVIFLVARSAFGTFLARRAGPWLVRLREGFTRDALNYLLFLRLVPAFPFWLVNIAPALLGMDLPRYVAATFVGIIPGTFAFALLGAGLDGLFAEQDQAYKACLERAASAGAGEKIECNYSLDPASLLTTELIAAFVALGLVALIPVIYRRMRSR